ncbi:MAG: zinc-finger domain-containing protein [Proteobacteria bacterium]|nr:zinc-finger domain-containing protein [Pseudomonadota bacterium]
MSATAAAAGTPLDRILPANAEHRYNVTRADLPLSCPMPGMSLWNSHPKVYLPVEATGTAQCPYCSAVYTLTD